jgi:hypothetical protein
MPRAAPPLAVAATLAVALAAAALGCAGPGAMPERTATAPAPASRPATPGGSGDRAASPPRRSTRHRPAAPRCPADRANCAAASGRVIALESVDPDGDGDLHLILAGGSITLPGVTVLDVSRALRPRHDPRIGDWAAGAGPVYRGSHGQRQIQVERIVVFPHR